MIKPPVPVVRRAAAAVGAAALVAYGGLKAAWGAGSTIGIRDVAVWEAQVRSLPGWGWFVAMWGTVLLDLAGAAVLACLVTGRGGARVQLVLRRIAWVGVAVLGPVGVLGLASVAGPALGVWSEAPGPLATWVFVLVYGSFLALAAALAVLVRSSRREWPAPTQQPPAAGTAGRPAGQPPAALLAEDRTS